MGVRVIIQMLRHPEPVSYVHFTPFLHTQLQDTIRGDSENTVMARVDPLEHKAPTSQIRPPNRLLNFTLFRGLIHAAFQYTADTFTILYLEIVSWRNSYVKRY